MNKTARIGILIVILLVAGGYYFFKNTGRGSENHTYFGYYDNVQGLAEGAPVYLKGVAIGKVTDIALNGDQNIRISISLPKQHRLTEGCTAVLVSGSLIDNKSIEIHPGTKNNYLPDGALVQTAVDPNMIDNFSTKITPAIEQAKFLLQATDTGLNEFRHMITGGLTGRFVHLLIQLDSQTKQFSRIAADINKQSIAFTRTIRTASQATEDFNQQDNDAAFLKTERQSKSLATSGIHENTSDLKATVSSLRQHIEEVKQSSLIKDREKSADLSRSLDTLTRNLQSLQEDPPGISIFGGKKK